MNITLETSEDDFEPHFRDRKIHDELYKKARRETKTQFEIKRNALSVLVPHIIRRRGTSIKKQEGDGDNSRPAAQPEIFLSPWITLDGRNLLNHLHQTAEDLKFITSSSGYLLYIVDDITNEIFICSKSLAEITGRRFTWKITGKSTIAAYVAKENRSVIVTDAKYTVEKEFPDGQDLGDFSAGDILAIPVRKKDICVAVIELTRNNGIPYTKVEQNHASYIANLAGRVIARNRKIIQKRKSEEVNDMLIDEMLRGMTENLDERDAFASYIVNSARKTLDAESVTFYQVHEESDEYERKITSDYNPVLYLDASKKKARIEKEKRLSTIIKNSKTVVNFTDVFNDPRFNKDTDRYVGMLIRSVLGVAVPKEKDACYGAIVAINKLAHEKFSSSDESYIAAFARYLMIFLEYQKMYDKQQYSETSNLSFVHFGMSLIARRYEHPEMYVLEETIYLPPDFYKFNFVPNDPDEKEIPKYIYHIFKSVNKYFPDKDAIYKFIFAVKKVYRKLPYHNFTTAFLACHCIYLIIYYYPSRFPSTLEKTALLMAGLLFDADHRGLSAKYMEAVGDPIMNHAYTTPMEMHHYRVSKILIKATKILEHIPEEKIPRFFRIFKECVLSSNMEFYIRRRVDVRVWIKTNTLDWNNQVHRTGIRTIIITASGFISPVKGLEYCQSVIEGIFDELFHEGDLLREMGIQPPATMDREIKNSSIISETTFLSHFTLPCFEMLRDLFPMTEILHKNT
ncbi:unnamed protein product, partial [Hermetia illucens]